ncbi:hypothetical protein TIFTF001_021795 [Ficus carica]|uniref:Uncharacterized protein n=1 Tax=Ficus carica TaxID=3494 RepID=A0AA88DC88_FICCA|nr:hypothetical protein TIFTF001_021795 [Ficus carica]
MEILTGNVQNLTATIQILIKAFREFRGVLSHPAWEEEAEDFSPAGWHLSVERSRSLGLVVEHTGDRSTRGNLRRGRRDLEEYNLSRKRLRSRHARVTRSRTWADREELVSTPLVARSRRDRDQHRENTVIVSKSTHAHSKCKRSHPLQSLLPDPDRHCSAVVLKTDAREDGLVQAVGVKDNKLLWAITYDVPPTFVHLRGIPQKHAEADEYIKGRNSLIRETLRLAGKNKSKKDVHVRQDQPPRWPPAKLKLHQRPKCLQESSISTFPWNQNKYCNFHKDVGHETKDCIQLLDQIELLVRDRHRWEFIEKAITLASSANKISQVAHGEDIDMVEHIAKLSRQDNVPITFTDDEANMFLHPHNDALVEEIKIIDNTI